MPDVELILPSSSPVLRCHTLLWREAPLLLSELARLGCFRVPRVRRSRAEPSRARDTLPMKLLNHRLSKSRTYTYLAGAASGIPHLSASACRRRLTRSFQSLRGLSRRFLRRVHHGGRRTPPNLYLFPQSRLVNDNYSSPWGILSAAVHAPFLFSILSVARRCTNFPTAFSEDGRYSRYLRTG